jgi:hypothetical protein
VHFASPGLQRNGTIECPSVVTDEEAICRELLPHAGCLSMRRHRTPREKTEERNAVGLRHESVPHLATHAAAKTRWPQPCRFRAAFCFCGAAVRFAQRVIANPSASNCAVLRAGASCTQSPLLQGIRRHAPALRSETRQPIHRC